MTTQPKPLPEIVGDPQDAFICPHPWKRDYPDHDTAYEVLINTGHFREGVVPYLCRCTRWHLGHRKQTT